MKVILTEDLLRRFWSKVKKEDFHWIWIAGQDGYGYGTFWLHNKMIGAHIMSYLIRHKTSQKNFVSYIRMSVTIDFVLTQTICI